MANDLKIMAAQPLNTRFSTAVRMAPSQQSSIMPLLLVGALGLGALWYFKFRKKK